MLGMRSLLFAAAVSLALALPAPADDMASTDPLTVDQLTDNQKLVLEFLQNDGMAGLICYGGVVITPPPATGVTDPPRDNVGGGGPGDGSGDPPPPGDPGGGTVDPSNSPEPGSIVLGLIGIASGAAYLRRRQRKESDA